MRPLPAVTATSEPKSPAASAPAARRGEVAALLHLAWPLIVAYLAQMAMGVIDTAMIGRVSVDALAALALGNSVMISVLVTGAGVALGLDPHAARAVGAGDPRQAGRLLRQSVYLSTAFALPLVLVLQHTGPLLRAMGQKPEVVDLMVPYLDLLSWSVLPSMWTFCYRGFVSAAGRPTIVLASTIVATALKIALNRWFIFGGLGLDPMGLSGAALASLIARCAIVAVIAGYARVHPVFRPYRAPWGLPERASLVKLLRTGLPLGVQNGIEVAGFSLVTLLMGLVSSAALAAHQVALNVASVTFQVPFAIGAAAAVRVGHAVGRRDEPGLARAGWTAFSVGVVFGLGSALSLFVFRSDLALLYLPDADPVVLALTAHLLAIAAVFQLADGAQAIGFGVLRGLDDTRLPVLFNVLGYAILGLPFGWFTVFHLGWEPGMLWWGLSIALAAVSTLLALRFRAVTLRRGR